MLTNELPANKEFQIWRKKREDNTDYFTFCDYPFIMQIAFKAKILEEESKYLQDLELKNELSNINNIQDILFMF